MGVLSACIYVHHMMHACLVPKRGQKMVSGFLELKLQKIRIWTNQYPQKIEIHHVGPGTQTRSSGGAANALNHWVSNFFSLVSNYLILMSAGWTRGEVTQQMELHVTVRQIPFTPETRVFPPGFRNGARGLFALWRVCGFTQVYWLKYGSHPKCAFTAGFFEQACGFSQKPICALPCEIVVRLISVVSVSILNSLLWLAWLN